MTQIMIVLRDQWTRTPYCGALPARDEFGHLTGDMIAVPEGVIPAARRQMATYRAETDGHVAEVFPRAVSLSTYGDAWCVGRWGIRIDGHDAGQEFATSSAARATFEPVGLPADLSVEWPDCEICQP